MAITINGKQYDENKIDYLAVSGEDDDEETNDKNL